jgi:Nitroreductase
MDTLTSIFKRRSIRRFTAQAVEKGKVDMLLQAAMAAPTAKNMQDWEFLVVTSKEGKKKIQEAHPTGFVAANAPLAIIVCSNLGREKIAPGFFAQDCAAAIQNMMLAAYDMGLGSVWMGVYPRQDRVAAIKTAFDMPEDIQPVAVVVFGYADEQKPDQNRFDPEKVHYEKW